MSQIPEMIAAVLVPTVLFIGLPWLIFHYVTKWKSNAILTREDETLLDELHELARRCDERLVTVERIMSADNPDWRAIACDPAETGVERGIETGIETGIDTKVQTIRRVK